MIHSLTNYELIWNWNGDLNVNSRVNTSSTFWEFFAEASINIRPCSFANCSPSSVLTALLWARSHLFPISIIVIFSFACWRASSSQFLRWLNNVIHLAIIKPKKHKYPNCTEKGMCWTKPTTQEDKIYWCTFTNPLLLLKGIKRTFSGYIRFLLKIKVKAIQNWIEVQCYIFSHNNT